MEKPPILYHGSPHGEIDEFEPRAKPLRDEPPAVYATPSLAIAVMFMHKNQGLAGHFGDVPYTVLFGSLHECLENDHGGHVYELPADTFILNTGKGFGNDKEWVSYSPVKPLHKTEYPSAIDAMIESGVQVYIMDRSMYDQIKASADHGREIFRATRSENQSRGLNIRKF